MSVEYPLSDFLRDLRWLLCQRTLSGDRDDVIDPESLHAYFSEHYLDRSMLERRLDVCVSVGRWLDAHSGELADFALLIDNRNGTFTAPEAIFRALWDYFADRSAEQLEIDTPARHFVSRYFPKNL